MKAIVVTKKNVYGQDKIYPVCDHAKLLAELAGTKTLSEYSIKLIKKMGVKVALEELQPTHRYI
tara:strand:+ start:404 stop:595 length:192 start_codon:yes stop_codon:yes gene_type:complete